MQMFNPAVLSKHNPWHTRDLIRLPFVGWLVYITVQSNPCKRSRNTPFIPPVHRRTTAMLVTSNGQVASSSCPLLYSVNFVSQKETESMFFKDTVKVSLKFAWMSLILFCFVFGNSICQRRNVRASIIRHCLPCLNLITAEKSFLCQFFKTE